jgi:hypothetical protein
MRANTDVSLL